MRSMVEREVQALAGHSLSDPAPPGHLSLRERKDFGRPALMS